MEGIPLLDGEFFAIVHFDHHGAAHAVTGVVSLAAVGAGDRFYVYIPAPAGLEFRPAHGYITKLHQIQMAMSHKVSALIGAVQAFRKLIYLIFHCALLVFNQLILFAYRAPVFLGPANPPAPPK
jgi:hypothetical protein